MFSSQKFLIKGICFLRFISHSAEKGAIKVKLEKVEESTPSQPPHMRKPVPAKKLAKPVAEAKKSKTLKQEKTKTKKKPAAKKPAAKKSKTK